MEPASLVSPESHPTRPSRPLLQFVLFAAVAFGPAVLMYALGCWLMKDVSQYELQSPSAGVYLGAGSLLVLLLVVLLGTYVLWLRVGDRLVRGLVLLFAYELLLFVMCLLVGAALNRGTPIWRGFPGHPFIPVFATAATVLIYAQALIFPSVVIATVVLGRRLPAAEPREYPKMGIGTVLAVILLAVLPVTGVVGVHVGFFGQLRRDRDRERALSFAAEDVARAMDTYAAAHAGQYPPKGTSWEPGDSTGMAHWFRFYDAWHRDSTNEAIGRLPVNPFSGRRYEVGVDFFYFPDSLRRSGDNRRSSTYTGSTPFDDLAAPAGRPGTIVVLGYTPPGAAEERPTEYALIAFARGTREPWHATESYKVYGVIFGPLLPGEER